MFERLKSAARQLKREIEVYRRVIGDPRTPRIARWFLGIAVGYALSPIDIIPDFIPVLGHLDDLVIIPLLIFLALRFIPPEVIRDARDNIKQSNKEMR